MHKYSFSLCDGFVVADGSHGTTNPCRWSLPDVLNVAGHNEAVKK